MRRLLLAFLLVGTAFAQSPSPALLVLNKGANELAIVDPAAMKVVGRVPVGDGPHEVIFQCHKNAARELRRET